ncbi:molybdopterin cofactor-binding domain-containing protein [Mycolicibacterium boenickei]
MKSVQRALRVDACAKAHATALYTADVSIRDAAVGAVLTSKLPHSKVKVISDHALAIDGVLAVLDAEDDPGVAYNSTAQGGRQDMAVFSSEARFAGDIVGAVFAENRMVLGSALRAIKIIEEPIPSVVDIEAALDPSAPPAHTSYESNLIAHILLGDAEDEIESALAASTHVFDTTFVIQASPIGFLEPISAVAEWNGAVCHITSTAQCPSAAAVSTAQILGVDNDSVVLHPVLVGGSFGGKEEVHLEPIAALGSRALGGRKVVVEMTLAQMARFRHRHGGRLRVRTGVDSDGTFTARDIDWTLDAGPYAFHSPDVAGNGASLVHALYHASTRRTSARVVATNHTPGGAFRGYGGEQALFAVESHVDEIASALGIDAIDLRRRNMLKAGDTDPYWNWPIESFSLDSCLDAAERIRADLLPSTRDRNDGRTRGLGIAALANVSSITGPWGVDKASVRCSIDVDGTVHVESGLAEMGQGIHTALAGAVQTEFPGLAVCIRPSGTDTAPEDLGVYASRGSYLSVGAAVTAAQRLLREIRMRVNNVAIDTISRAGVSTSEGFFPWAAIGPLRAEGEFEAPDNAIAAGVQIALVAVDEHTGSVEVEQFVSIHDVGAVLQPEGAKSQVEGGVVQGIGFALTEQAYVDPSGATINVGYLDHLIPTSFAAPVIDAHFVTERPNPHSPVGAKGLGECPVMGVAPAIANAVADAVGARCRHIPITGERLLDALGADP